MRSLTASLVLAILVASCGGGGGDNSAPLPQPIRHNLYFGYFGDADGQIAEVRDHTNLQMIEGWGADGAMLRHAAEAVGAGQKILLAVCWRCGPDNIRWQFDQLRLIGALDHVVALYPQDEPDVIGLTDGDVRGFCNMLRSVVADYSELVGVAIAVIYGSTGQLPAADQFDWIGRDCYGCSGGVPTLSLLPHQRLLIVPGGADPWRESPDGFVAYANAHPEVVAIIAFLWRHPDTGHGIADNGMATAYRAAGMAVTGR